MIDESKNAMAAKTKAIYAKRLKENDYNNLLAKKSVAEIASYLKNETYFKDSLEGINEKALHRGQLEVIIRNDLIHRLSRVLRYGDNRNESFYNIIVTRSEINLVITSIRALISNEYEALVVKLPIAIENQMCFDIKKMANCRSFEELLAILKGTPYYKIVIKYQLTNMSDFDFVGLEEELQRHYYDMVMKLVNYSFKDKENKKAIEEIFYTEVELDNISKIYRLKKYFNAPQDKIKAMMTPIYLKLTKNDLEDLIDNVDADNIFDRLNKTAYKGYLKDTNFIFIEHTAEMIKNNLNRKHLLFSSDSDLVLLTYMTLMDIEIKNIIEIIEGVRYNIPSEQIKRMLIY